MFSENSNSSKSQPAPTQPRKPIELISEVLRRNSSGNGAATAPQERGTVADDMAEGVRPRDGSTSKPESRPPSEPPRPALELDDDDDVGDPRERQTKQRRSLHEIAEETGVPLKRIYDAVVDLGIEGEEPVTVGTLKDQFRESREILKQRDTFEHERDTAQVELLTARSQVQSVVDRIVSVVGTETFERVLGDVRQEVQARLQTARAQLLEWYPQWSDVAVMHRDRERLEKGLLSYGWSKHDVAALQDPRAVKFALDSLNLRERYERLKAGTVEKLPTTQPASTKKHRASTFDEAKAVAARTGDPKAGITKLLGG